MTSTQARIQDILKKGGSKKVQKFCRPFFKLGTSVFQVFLKLYKDLICKNFPRRWQKFEKKILRPFSKNILTPQTLMNIWQRRRRYCQGLGWSTKNGFRQILPKGGLFGGQGFEGLTGASAP